jgi:hypothetical protein
MVRSESTAMYFCDERAIDHLPEESWRLSPSLKAIVFSLHEHTCNHCTINHLPFRF